MAQAKSLIEPAKKQIGRGRLRRSSRQTQTHPDGSPEYTEEARAAAIEGKVRVEITVDASGAIRSVKVLEGLGHGLDEAAYARSKVRPSSRLFSAANPSSRHSR